MVLVEHHWFSHVSYMTPTSIERPITQNNGMTTLRNGRKNEAHVCGCDIIQCVCPAQFRHDSQHWIISLPFSWNLIRTAGCFVAACEFSSHTHRLLQRLMLTCCMLLLHTCYFCVKMGLIGQTGASCHTEGSIPVAIKFQPKDPNTHMLNTY